MLNLKRRYYSLLILCTLSLSQLSFSQIHCGSLELVSNTTIATNMTFNDFTTYQAGINLNSVVRLRVKVENKAVVDLDCSWKLRMFIENNSGAGTPITEWEEITLYGNGLGSNPTISDLEVRVRNTCDTPVDSGFRSFTDVNDILDIIEELVPQVIVPAGSCTKNVNGPGSYLTNYDEYNFDVDLRFKPGFTRNPGVFKLNIRFRLEEVN